jgi:RimJ/RimL family protein N-acetyltransferase
MGRLFTLLWQRAGADLGAEGVATTFSRISAFNRASIAAHRRLGARIVGQAIFLVAGRVQITLSSLGPRFHLSWRRDQVPAITLRDERGAAV